MTNQRIGLGADDYIVKAFFLSELGAHVKADIAQYEQIKGGSQELMGEFKPQVMSVLIRNPTGFI